jgi:acetylornithine deacetylase/succinyl-diaminopimelate desuccinylase-like protein
MEVLLGAVGDLAGTEVTPDNVEALVEEFGPTARLLWPVIRNTANPTRLDAGYKVNVVPAEATAEVDGRFLPGFHDEFLATMSDLVGEDIEVAYLSHQEAVETAYEGRVVDAMHASIRAEDPEASVLPYLMPAGTDGKHWASLGIRCFGFTPLRLPDELDFSALFHGVDERVPVDALEFGARVLDRFLDLA